MTTHDTPERAALRAALAMRAEAQAEAEAICDAVARAAELVAELDACVAGFADVDAAAAQHRAKQIKAASPGLSSLLSLHLPPDLAHRLRARTVAQAEAEAARAAWAALSAEAVGVERGLEISMAAVEAAAAAVMRSEVEARAERLIQSETQAAALRQHIQAYVALGTGMPGALHQAAPATQALIQARPRNATVQRTREQTEEWAAYHRDLTGNADASCPPVPAQPLPSAGRSSQQAQRAG